MRWFPVFVVSLASACGGGNDRPFRPPQTPDATKADANEGSGGADLMKPAKTEPEHAKPDQVGLATWYGEQFAGKKTSNGERFDPAKMTAAHRKLPFGTWVEVRRVDTGRTVRVRINDRGPWGDDKRIIDVSKKAAEDLELVRDGVARVELRVVDGP
ncbi:MAG TPA: septal ring lytic transglycosylase RlpA family protein [Labilithrix sp.]